MDNHEERFKNEMLDYHFSQEIYIRLSVLFQNCIHLLKYQKINKQTNKLSIAIINETIMSGSML